MRRQVLAAGGVQYLPRTRVLRVPLKHARGLDQGNHLRNLGFGKASLKHPHDLAGKLRPLKKALPHPTIA